jgi:hypothetical protein
LSLLLFATLFRKNILNAIGAQGIVSNVIYFVVILAISVPSSMYMHHLLISQKIQVIPHQLNENEIQESLISYLRNNGHHGLLNVRVSIPREVISNQKFEVLLIFSSNNKESQKVGIYFTGIETEKSEIILKEYRKDISDNGYFPTAAGMTVKTYQLEL